MKRILPVIFLFLMVFTGCKKGQNAFPEELAFRETINNRFSSLWKTQDPALVADLAKDIADDLSYWGPHLKEMEAVILQEGDEDLIREWRQFSMKAYQMVVDNHVRAYQMKSEMENPRYYQVRKEILQSLDSLILQMNRFVHQVYPMRDLDIAYYKNLPEITSRTADTHAHLYYVIEVEIGYLRGENKTQTALNSNKGALVDIIRSYCSQLTEEELLKGNELNVKAGLQREINDYLLQFYDFKEEKLEGVKIITISSIHTFEFN